MGAVAKLSDHELFKDQYWRGLLFLFQSHPKLKKYLQEPYVDIESGVINTFPLKKLSLTWSNSERFMLDLALHLFNDENEVNLSDMDYLDRNNKELAMRAIRLRFG
jgi:hypothetical protein